MLTKIAIAGGVLAFGGAYYFHRRLQNDIRQQEYYKKSIDMLRGYPPAIEKFGKPIVPLSVDLQDKELYMDGTQARLIVPLRGPKDTGTLYSWCSREKPGVSWNVDQLDLEVKSSHQRWTFYKKRDSLS